MYHQNPRPRTFAELSALLDKCQHHAAPVPEVIKPHEAKRMALIAKIYERLAGED